MTRRTQAARAASRRKTFYSPPKVDTPPVEKPEKLSLWQRIKNAIN